jgi:hypothetical protein
MRIKTTKRKFSDKLVSKNKKIKMENLDNKKWSKQPATAPEGLFNQVRERIIHERVQAAQTHRQLVIGSALLLVVGAFNIGFIILKIKQKQPVLLVNTEQLLYETYFDNTLKFSNEK